MDKDRIGNGMEQDMAPGSLAMVDIALPSFTVKNETMFMWQLSKRLS